MLLDCSFFRRLANANFIFYVGISLFLTICSRLLFSFGNLCDLLVWSISFTFAHNSDANTLQFYGLSLHMCVILFLCLCLCLSVYGIHLFWCRKYLLWEETITSTWYALLLPCAFLYHLLFRSLIIIICTTFLLYFCLCRKVCIWKKRDSKKKFHLSKINERLKV